MTSPNTLTPEVLAAGDAALVLPRVMQPAATDDTMIDRGALRAILAAARRAQELEGERDTVIGVANDNARDAQSEYRANAELRAHVTALRESLHNLRECSNPFLTFDERVVHGRRLAADAALESTPAQSLADVQARARAEALSSALNLFGQGGVMKTSTIRSRIRALAAESKS